MITAKLGKVKVGDGHPVSVIGVINLSPDSFYPQSVRGPEQALARAREMIKQGVAIIDVGAMATGPRAKPIPVNLELHRMVPAVKAIAKLGVTVSADTQRAEVAEAAVGAGASVVNDVSGLKADPNMAEVIASRGCSAILMASDRAPGDVYEVGEIRRALAESLGVCKKHGIPLERVVLDPAVGYWPARLKRLGRKFKGQVRGRPYPYAAFLDLRILARLSEFRELGRPICVGISRKSFLGAVLGLKDPSQRLAGSLAASAVAVFIGVDVLRAHDPAETMQAARIAEAIRSAR
jgi:dihydropteroate synthase